MSARKKPDLSMTTVREATIDVVIGDWLKEPLGELIAERFPDHIIDEMRVTDWDGYTDGYLQVHVRMSEA